MKKNTKAEIAGGVALSEPAKSARATSGQSSAARRWDNAPWRPPSEKRLCDRTHELARMSLSGEHGRSMECAKFALSPEEIEGSSPDRIYGLAAKKVGEMAPLRILAGELVVGSATLGEAARHQAPVAGCGSVSHTTIGFATVLHSGTRALRRRVEERPARSGLDEKGADFLESMLLCLDGLDAWKRRHVEALERRVETSSGSERAAWERTLNAVLRVPENPPETFHEAVQSLRFLYGYQKLMGNWSGLGRIDEMLGRYLERDLKAGRITRDEAREILAHFWIKGTEWTGWPEHSNGSGDAQHYQNVILGGVDAEGREVTNDVTYLVLDVVEELVISDFPIAVRINRRTPERLLRRIAEVQRHGGGIVAVYNEEVVIDGLVQFGFPIEEARTFTNDGCWEVLIPGRTAFSYSPFDALAILQNALGLHGSPDDPAPEFEDFDSLYAAFLDGLTRQIDSHHAAADNFMQGGSSTPLLSLFVEDCIERARNYNDRGARYNIHAPHAGGLANVADSLLAVKKMVYEDQVVSLQEFVVILRNDWEGQEQLRRRVREHVPAYGNDNAEADAMMERVFNDYAEIVARVRERNGVLRPAGISTFGREIGWSATRSASPDGHHVGDVLATNFSPSPGKDRQGPTAVLRSYCRMDFTKTPNGATVEVKALPDSVRGEAGLDAMVALSRAFVALGGFYMHTDVVDSEMLRDAQAHPDKYPNLSVRISGWSARFATMSKEWQDMVINRTQQIL